MDNWARLSLALRVLAVDPVGLGGLWLRSRAGPVRDIATTALTATPFDRPKRRLDIFAINVPHPPRSADDEDSKRRQDKPAAHKLEWAIPFPKCHHDI